MDTKVITDALELIALTGAGIAIPGASLAAVRYLWLKAASHNLTIQSERDVAIAQAVHKNALPPNSLHVSSHYAPHISQSNSSTAQGFNGNNDATQGGDHIFELIDKALHLSITGGTGAGKTMLINEMVERKWHKSGHVAVVDIDNYPGKWHSACKVFGACEDFIELDKKVTTVLDKVIKDREERHNQTGAIPSTRLHFIIDEAHEVFNNCKGILGQFERMVKRGRKLGISMAILSPDNQMGSLNLKGKMQLLRNLKHFDLTEENGQRWATAGEKRYMIPQTSRPLPKEDNSLALLSPAVI